jgi:hypothetical protein
MARYHHSLEGREAAVDIRAERNELALESLQLAFDVDLPLSPNAFQIFDLAFELLEWLLEVEGIRRGHMGHPALT